MRKLSYIVLGIIIGALSTYYFCPKQISEDPVKIVKPKGVISVEKAKELNANWTLHRKASVDSAAQKQGRNQDDRSTYWSLEDIENYLGYAKNQADSLGYQMTGIRVYLGVYGKNAGQTKKDLTTMFIVPTGKKSTESSLNLNFRGNDGDIPGEPLNEGTGGQAGYPN
ncbi:hypothetical protein [Thalassobellus suaedae]|uniref:Uncharacterized protein n=1 Tax=Thalassobellus suaedae TaxID=3074124 RepID=A0ABY9XX55_9FLAO|nr:hypothetical protein RHP51_07705 [Flavobacteriaceae bacterium HL-DH14]